MSNHYSQIKSFHPDNAQSSDNAFNKQTTREKALPSTTNEGHTYGFHPENVDTVLKTHYHKSPYVAAALVGLGLGLLPRTGR